MKLRKTPLFTMHQKYQGKMIDFEGWQLPVEYNQTGIIEEHRQVRRQAGLFDVSHMGQIKVQGKEAETFIQELMTNDVSTLRENHIRYSPMCYPDGGCVDDLLIYKYSPEYFLVVVNAANTDKDFAWMQEHKFNGCTVEDLSNGFAQLALQGPLSERVLQDLCEINLREIRAYSFRPRIKVAGIECLVSRTGYTGEDGFELYTVPSKAGVLWEAILTAGKGTVRPIGLGARDTLRFEAGLPLYGRELSKKITPLEARLDRFVRLDKTSFIGKKALAEQQQNGPQRLLVGFEMMGRGIPRTNYEIHYNGQNIGWVTSGGFAPTLGKNIGWALIKNEFAQPDQELDIIIRNKPIKIRIDKNIFYRRSKQTKRSGS